MVGNKVYLAVANHGSDGRYETHSRIYTMDKTGMLTVIQNISTQRASDVKFFSPPGQSDIYLIVANQMNNAGETHISSQVKISFVRRELSSCKGISFVVASSGRLRTPRPKTQLYYNRLRKRCFLKNCLCFRAVSKLKSGITSTYSYSTAYSAVVREKGATLT